MLPIANAVLQQLNDTEANAEHRNYSPNATKDGQENQVFEMGDAIEGNNRNLKVEDSSVNMGVCLRDWQTVSFPFSSVFFFFFKKI